MSENTEDGLVQDQLLYIEHLEAERGALVAHVGRLRDTLNALVMDSEGVYGLHLNGDDAPWGDLLAGGRFEEWLIAFDEAPATSLARRDAEQRAGAVMAFANDVWDEMLKRQKVIKVMPLTMAKDWIARQAEGGE